MQYLTGQGDRRALDPARFLTECHLVEALQLRVGVGVIELHLAAEALHDGGEDGADAAGASKDYTTWLPEDAATATVTAVSVLDPDGNVVPVIGGISVSVLPGKVSNHGGKYTNDPNISDVTDDFTYIISGNGINLTCLDFGGSITITATATVNIDGNEVVIQDDQLDACIEAITGAARTGKIGDGKIFVTDLEQVIRIRTGEEGDDAL